MNNESAVFGGGCFWCTEAIFQRLKGVVSVEPGYSGGHASNPTYEQVSGGNTGHVESIKIDFDPGQISFEILLNVFFATHDPTQKNQQGHDIGPQYQSTVFYMDEKQEHAVREFIKKLDTDGTFGRPVATEIKAFEKFYPAESYHRNYYNDNQGMPYCQVVINPKLEKLRSRFADLLN
ncbi:MAG: peptide-methionine (S)-S-oxide reductase MsrA [Candidatus Doudnabacteria bacterium]|nr:peptide-methionine (S)-S-oxide reductase MsrA [Candidatus Doudnabacteria bacterium]